MVSVLLTTDKRINTDKLSCWGYEASTIERLNRIVVISTGATRSGEIYLDRF
ncbi:hypothetical protein BCL90_4250 [Pedobacter alluvionis]|uniref:Uncharacterized protein n=1 Tax=Pedobacter alluvionis TaxID=475253 RepID=A0A497XTF5_9SPHI|nr:hypothetical protein BCL90_4250 [Pedobacter alluvionis]